MSTTDRPSTRTKSDASITSSKSSTYAARELYANTSKKKAARSSHALPKFINISSEVKQRVVSARVLYKKAHNNKLIEAEQIISKLKQENRMLHTIHQRQDAALSKYESSHADLPSLMRSHFNQISAWENEYRKHQAEGKELEGILKSRENVIQELNEQIKHLAQLTKNKNLDELHLLLERIRDAEIQLDAKDEELSKAEHLLTFEIQRAKQQLQQEEKKSKEFSTVLEKVRLEALAQKKLDIEMNRRDKSKVRFQIDETTTASESNIEDNDLADGRKNVKKIKPKIRIECGHGDAGADVKELTAVKSKGRFMRLPKKSLKQPTSKEVPESKINEKHDNLEAEVNFSQVSSVDEKDDSVPNLLDGATNTVSDSTADNSPVAITMGEMCVLGGLGSEISELQVLSKEYKHLNFPDTLAQLERQMPTKI